MIRFTTTGNIRNFKDFEISECEVGIYVLIEGQKNDSDWKEWRKNNVFGLRDAKLELKEMLQLFRQAGRHMA